MKKEEKSPLDLEEELFLQFGIPKGTPLEEIPFQFIRHIVLYGTYEEEMAELKLKAKNETKKEN